MQRATERSSGRRGYRRLLTAAVAAFLGLGGAVALAPAASAAPTPYFYTTAYGNPDPVEPGGTITWYFRGINPEISELDLQDITVESELCGSPLVSPGIFPPGTEGELLSCESVAPDTPGLVVNQAHFTAWVPALGRWTDSWVTTDVEVGDGTSPSPHIGGNAPPGRVGVLYEFEYAVSGDPEPTVSLVSGDLPPGLSMDDEGEISGRPTTVGSYPFRVQAQNGQPQDDSAFLDQQIVISGAPTVTGAPPAGVVGTAYSFEFDVTGAPAPIVTVTSGAVPPGLSVDSDGVVSGTPTVAGHYLFSLTAANGVAPDAVLPTSLFVDPQPAPPIAQGNTPEGQIAVPYSYQLELSGEPFPTVSLSSGAFPPGLTLGSAGLISGTPTVGGDYVFTVEAQNGQPQVTESFLELRLIVREPAVITGTPPDATVGAAYSFAFSVTGVSDPVVTVDSGSPPPGLSVSTAGVVTGTPTAAGTYQFTLRGTNGATPDGVLATSITVAAAPAPPHIAGAAPPGVVGLPYSFSYTLTGEPPPTASISGGSLPPGLVLSADGTISGTPTTAGAFDFTVGVENGVPPDLLSAQEQEILIVQPRVVTGLTVSASASPNPATPGEPITWSATVTNTGDVVATGLAWTSTLCGGGTLPDLAPGATSTTFGCTSDAPVARGLAVASGLEPAMRTATTLSNTFTVTGTSGNVGVTASFSASISVADAGLAATGADRAAAMLVAFFGLALGGLVLVSRRRHRPE